MRPIVRGTWPANTSGTNQSFHQYRDARNELANRLGWYCSYCELPKQEALDVEHMIPKDLAPEKETDWNNFLLACTACNSRKGVKPDPAHKDSYLWPDQDNTFLAIDWVDCVARPRQGLTSEQTALAKSAIALCVLDANPKWKHDTKDTRFFMRLGAHAKAMRSKSRLSQSDSPQMRAEIAESAHATGFFSVWMQIFADDPDMRRRFIDAFPGTAKDCFDANGDPVLRPGGRV